MFDENFQVYGVRKVWRQLEPEGFEVAHCTVARLMRDALQGVIRGRRARTTVNDKATACPLDHVNRQFRAPRPNLLWVSDFTYVATWTGFVYEWVDRLTTAGCWSPSETSRPPRPKPLLRKPGGTRSDRRPTDETASELPGAVQSMSALWMIFCPGLVLLAEVPLIDVTGGPAASSSTHPRVATEQSQIGTARAYTARRKGCCRG